MLVIEFQAGRVFFFFQYFKDVASLFSVSDETLAVTLIFVPFSVMFLNNFDYFLGVLFVSGFN